MRAAALVVGALLGCGRSTDSDFCGADALAEQLRTARAGEVVLAEPCEYRGSFQVPAGVTLRGVQGSRLTGRGTDPAVTILAGDGVAALEQLEVVSSERASEDDGPGHVQSAAVRVESGARGRLASVHLTVGAGAGVYVGSGAELALEQAELVGAVRGTPGAEPMPSVFPTYALFAEAGAEVTMRDVVVDGFAHIAVGATDANVDVSRTTIRNTVGTGFALSGGRLTLHEVTVQDLGQPGLAFSHAVSAADGASVVADDLAVTGSDAFAILLTASSMEASSLTISDNLETGAWLQDNSSLSVDGGRISDAGGAGILVMGEGTLQLSDLTIERTGIRPLATDGAAVIDAGDGVVMTGVPSQLSLTDVELLDNERVGFLLDLAGGDLLEVALTGVRVSGTGEQLGAIIQNGRYPQDWDDEVERQGATAANDAVFRDELLVP